MKRYGSVIGVRPESLAAYKKYHTAVWPEVLAMIRRCNIRNYSIYLKDELLFGYFEYYGADYADRRYAPASLGLGSLSLLVARLASCAEPLFPDARLSRSRQRTERGEVRAPRGRCRCALHARRNPASARACRSTGQSTRRDCGLRPAREQG